MPSTPLTSNYSRTEVDRAITDDSDITDELNVTDTTTNAVLLDLTKTRGLDVNVASTFSPSLSVTGVDNTNILVANSASVTANRTFQVTNGNDVKFSVERDTGTVMSNGKFHHYRAVTAPGDLYEMMITRNSDYSGGPGGSFNSSLRVVNNCINTGQENESCVASLLANNSPNGIKMCHFNAITKNLSGGPTAGSVFYITDNQTNPTTETLGTQIQMRTTGTDNNNNRIGISVISGDSQLIGSGVAQIDTGMEVITGGANSSVKRAFVVRGNVGTALDVSEATLTAPAIKMKTGNMIRFNNTNRDLFYDAVNQRLAYHTQSNSTVGAFWFNDNGNFTINKGGVGIYPVSYTGVASTGAASVSFGGGNKPGTDQVNPHMWVDIVLNGVECCYPVWRKV